jgi:hypothetical protein
MTAPRSIPRLAGGTGTGKTTLVNAVAAFIPDSERVVIIEDTSEIQIAKPNLVRLEALSAGQLYDVCFRAGVLQTLRKLVRSLLTGMIFVLVQDDVDPTIGWTGNLGELSRCEVCAEGAGGIAEAGLPQHGQVEPAFAQDHGGKLAHRLPRKQIALGSRQQPVRKSGADAAAVEVDDLVILPAGEDHTPAEDVSAVLVDPPRVEQWTERTALCGEVTP